MAIVRVTALKDFRTNSLSTTDVSTGYQLGAPTTGQKLYMGMHLITAASTARPLVMTVQSATSSAFGAPTTRATFGLSSVKGAEWATPVLGISTEQSWFRLSWTLSTATSTAGAPQGLVYAGIR